jgi:hypothetical protein
MDMLMNIQTYTTVADALTEEGPIGQSD